MTSGWTGERMDDLKHQVDELSRRTDEGFPFCEFSQVCAARWV